ASRRQHLRNLFSKLAVALKRGFNVGANRSAKTFLQRRQSCLRGLRCARCGRSSAGFTAHSQAWLCYWQSLFECAVDGAADAVLEFVVSGFLKGAINSE